LLDHDIADRFFAAAVAQARLRRYLSSDHFSVDGTVLEAWASHKSFKPKDRDPNEPPLPGRRRGVEMLRYQHGSERLDAVVRNAVDLGPDPFSVLAWHNSLWLDIKFALRSCCYCSAAVAAGTLGQRMLNHMVLDPGGDFGATPSNPLTFQNALRSLTQWGVLEPGVAEMFDELRKQRNALAHFDEGLYAQLRTSSLSVVGWLRDIIDAQFGILVQRRLIADTPGVMFVRRDVEDEPFVRR
jgi:hypothetical protein